MKIEIQYATFWKRVGAGFLDFAALAPLQWLHSYIWNSTENPFILILFGILSSFSYLAYSIYFISKFGMTPGKMVTGVIVKKLDESSIPTVKQAILRDIVTIIINPILCIIMIINVMNGELGNRGHGDFEHVMILTLIMGGWGFLEFVTMLMSKKRRAVHDFIAGTVVVRGRGDFEWSKLPILRWALIVLLTAQLIIFHLTPAHNMKIPNQELQPTVTKPIESGKTQDTAADI